MFSKIEYSKDLGQSIEYNEQKQAQGEAEFLHAGNFIKDSEILSKEEKIQWLERLTSLNERVIVNTIHLSINFSTKDTISNEKMSLLSQLYMESMGLGQQPYLVYRHYDAGHPNLHVVAPKIRQSGDRIVFGKKDLHESLKITRELEKRFSLIQRIPRKERLSIGLRQPQPATGYTQRVEYGQMPTMPAISNVLNSVVDGYKYTNMKEFNAVLRLYNIKADRGREGGRMYQQKGLLYRVLDERGKKIGLPVKASLFDSKPTLHRLEEKFALNESLREAHRARVTTYVDWTFGKSPHNLEDFKEAMQGEKISVVTQLDKKGELQGIQYVDHYTKSVFDGASLGPAYSAEAIRERAALGQSLKQQEEQTLTQEIRLRVSF